MRRGRRAIRGFVAATAVLVAATACYPPSQTPVGQSIPPGGRVVATSGPLTGLWIDHATDDLSGILYGVEPLDLDLDPSTTPRATYRVYDDNTGTSTSIPTGDKPVADAALSPDGRSVVFSSPDRDLQADPADQNCKLLQGGVFGSVVSATCRELYLYDLDTGQTRQLTGLGTPSTVHHDDPTFTEDGTALELTTFSGVPTDPRHHARLDLATGAITETPAPPRITSWDRGDHVVSWDVATGILTSQDSTTGQVTVLWSDPAIYYLASATSDGRFVVVALNTSGSKMAYRLIDTDSGAIRVITSSWVSEDGSRYATVQENVAPDGIDRLIIAPVPA